MRLRAKIAAGVLVLALGAGAVAGCAAQETKADVNADIPEGAAPTMPVSHEGRYDRLGANGCYGCHGANADANPMLKQATALPEDHYTTESPQSITDMSADHSQCNTCHVQGALAQEDAQ